MERLEASEIKKIDKSRRKLFGISFIVLTAFVIIYHKYVPYMFYNNDDFFMEQIVSGNLTGQPESHLLHIGYIVGALLSALYRFIPNVAWYGWLLSLSIVISISTVISLCVSRCKHLITKLATFAGGFAVFYLFLFQHIVLIQFTTVAAFVAAASVCWFYFSHDEEKPGKFIKQNVPGLLLLFLALCIRDTGCLMIMPMYLFIGVVKILHNKKMCKTILAYASTVIIVVIAVIAVNRLSTMSDEWKEYYAYNTSRSVIYDYQGYPDYETNRATYDELGISYSSYVGASERYMLLLDDHIDADSMKVLERLGKAEKQIDLKTMSKEFIKRQYDYADRPINLLVAGCYLAVILLLILTGKWAYLADVAAVIAGKACIWGYLLYVGRSPIRVTQGIFITELFLLFGIAFAQELWKREKHFKKLTFTAWTVIMVSLLVICGSRGYLYEKQTEEVSKASLYSSGDYRQMQAYFHQSPDTLYLLDVNSFSYFSKDIFTIDALSCDSSLYLGGWQANSPWYDKVLKNKGILSVEGESIDSDRIRYVFLNDENLSPEYLKTYFEMKYYGSQFVLTETVTTDTGREFGVFCVTNSDEEHN